MERSVVEGFYVVGGTLARDAPSYVERGADKRLLAALQQGEICYVLTSRQMGKSSLMVRTAVRLREQRTSVAVLDFTSLGQNLTAMQWYNGLLERMGQQLGLEDQVEDSWMRSEHLGPFQRWVQAMRQVVLPSCPGRLVIFIDEIDTVRSLPFPTDELFAGIRELYNRRSEDPDLKRLTFCLLGVATPSDLIRDTRTTPFNIGRRIELTDFSAEEAAPLALGMGREHAVGQRFLKRILYWTGGHPYLTQRLCQAVAEDPTLPSSRSVDEICSNLFLSHRARERDDNLLFVRDRLLRSEVDKLSLLNLYASVLAGGGIRDDEANPLVGVLRLSGIAAIDDGYLRVRNRIYQHVFNHEWINSNLPGSELRRQRAAYKKGFKRAAWAAVLVAVMAVVGYRGYSLYGTNTTPPNIAIHIPRPVFWLSSSMRTVTADTGLLNIKASDDNVAVFINNEQFGITNKGGFLSIPGLPPGAYNIRVEKPGFQTLSITNQELYADQAVNLSIQMQRLITSGTVQINDALPETTVRLDGTYVGETDSQGSLSLKASPGNHDLEFAKDGYISEHLTEHVILGKTEIVNRALKPDLELRDWREITDTKNPEVFLAFVKKHPESHFAHEARRNAQNLEWNSVKDSTDLRMLDDFVNRYPDSQFVADARNKISQIGRETEDYKVVSSSEDPAYLQQFLSKYPNGVYTQRVHQQLRDLQDRRAILEVIREYQQAFDRKDMDAILRLWPKCPDDKKRKLSDLFSRGQSGTLKLNPTAQPKIAGDTALVICEKTRSSPGATSTTSAEIRLVKQAASWVIEGGSL